MIVLPAVLALCACVRPPPGEPGLAGYLHIFRAVQDERHACAMLGPDCAGPLEQSLARSEAMTPPGLLLDPGDAAMERHLAQSAMQAAHADCRARGIKPGSPRWDSCRVDRGIARLNELATLR
ncbi:hypothetical protein J8J14_03020 [Roseomonas sp. SSH11]|uniref:Lipoprotein n=1 Tax=Pararoseomonas baculiformis TaxID=2820812 RepID=A0ABS4AB18_9PROT|nr:hypothetical protein [Pararoseomonas baculiformis]MBP0443740.1 hypothetical protein [Pararoseomonas baculiformis]